MQIQNLTFRMTSLSKCAGVLGLLVFGLITACLGQNGEREFLDGSFSTLTNPALARYYRESTASEDGTVAVRIHYINDTLKMVGRYTDDNYSQAIGTFSFFHRNGVKESEGSYCAGKKCGVWKRWDTEGNPRSDRVYPDGVTEVLVSEPATFPGGYDAMTRFISTNIRYPLEAIEKNITGRVKISFRIDEGGLVRDVEVLERNAPLISQAALECIYEMPIWAPATKNGMQISSTFILPIDFAIEDNIGVVRVGS